MLSILFAKYSQILKTVPGLREPSQLALKTYFLNERVLAICSCAFVIQLVALGMEGMRGQFVRWYLSESTLPESGLTWDPDAHAKGFCVLLEYLQESYNQEIWPRFQSYLRKLKGYILASVANTTEQSAAHQLYE